MTGTFMGASDMPPLWTIVACDAETDFEIAIEEWKTMTITENFDGVSVQITIPGEVTSASAIKELVTDLELYRNQTLAYLVRVMTIDFAFTTESYEMTVTANSYDAILNRRIIFVAMDNTEDQHDYAWSLVAYTQALEDLGIVRVTGASGQSRHQTLDAGATIRDSINNIAANSNGFDWWIDENKGFFMQTPRRLRDSGLEWVWGALVQSFDVASAANDYASVVMATGATQETTLPSGITYPPPDPQVQELSDKPYGRWELTISFSDIVTTDSLNERAQWQLADSVFLRPSYKLVMTPGVWTPATDPGDTFTFRVNTDAFQFRIELRIEEIGLSIDADGKEDVTIGARANAIPDFIAGEPPAMIDPTEPPFGGEGLVRAITRSLGITPPEVMSTPIDPDDLLPGLSVTKARTSSLQSLIDLFTGQKPRGFRK